MIQEDHLLHHRHPVPGFLHRHHRVCRLLRHLRVFRAQVLRRDRLLDSLLRLHPTSRSILN